MSNSSLTRAFCFPPKPSGGMPETLERTGTLKIRATAVALAAVLLLFSGGCSSFRSRPDVSPAVRQEIVAIAMEYKGVPYRWGGNSADGFDCAGYVQFVFSQAGFTVPRTSGRQFAAGYEIDRDQLKQGDLVFFTKPGLLSALFPPNHVGIYIGSGRFIHAPSSGKNVRIDRLSNVYWRRHYKGARTLLR